LKGQKRSLYLGGVNVPFLVRWPGVVPAGRVDKTSVLGGVDVMPTILAALNLKGPEGYQSDGVNALAALKGQSWKRSQPLFWEWRGPHNKDVDWPTHAIRHDDHVLLHDEHAARMELYNVITDRNQETNLASTQPELASTLKSLLDDWRNTIPPFVQSPSANRLEVSGKKKSAMKSDASSKTATPDRQMIFKRWDTNFDNELSLDEYVTGFVRKAEAPERFKSFDKDNDGKLSHAEFVTPNK
jgi:arylsulfatase A-like enzyme